MVFPNRNSIGLLALLLAMWYAGASQDNAAVYLLAFVLIGIAAASVLHATANLRGVSMTAEPIKPAFAGDEISARLVARTESRRPHSALRVKAAGGTLSAYFPNVSAGMPSREELRLRAGTRGRHDGFAIHLTSVYPLGFFTARRTLHIAQPYLVYPRPNGSLPLPVSRPFTAARGDGLRMDGDDFAGTRAYQIGESQRHIDWKAAARGQPLLIKQWAGEAGRDVHLDWDDLPNLETEARLSQLAKWLLTAEKSGAMYGLRLPGQTLPPDRGEVHLHASLRALALHPAPAARQP